MSGPPMSHQDYAFCTLVTSDSYVLPAAVLAQSLRETHTSIPFCVIATQDTLSPESFAALSKIAHQVFPVSSLSGVSSDNLTLIGRPDLHATLTKLHLWSLCHFRRILYLDADTLVLRNVDHLFSLPASIPFAASPELGFPDCFNSGMMLLQPSQSTYKSLLRFASTADSFDGGDQGLLNMFFGDGARGASSASSAAYVSPPHSPALSSASDEEMDGKDSQIAASPSRPWHRLSFTYNMEMHKVYRLYIPAALRYRDEHRVLHFIGKDKPWDFVGGEVPLEEGAAGYQVFYAEMVKRWWDVRGRVDVGV